MAASLAPKCARLDAGASSMGRTICCSSFTFSRFSRSTAAPKSATCQGGQQGITGTDDPRKHDLQDLATRYMHQRRYQQRLVWFQAKPSATYTQTGTMATQGH